MNIVRVVKNRILEMFTENDGKLSLSRVSSGSIVFATLGWVTYLVIKNAALPDLTGPAVLVGGGGAAHYGIGKWFGKKEDVPEIPGALNANSAPPDVTLTPGTELPKKN